MGHSQFTLVLLVGLFCFTFTKFSDDFEGDCSNFHPKIQDSIDEDWILKIGSKNVFIPMANKLFYYGVALLLDGTFQKDMDVDYERICLGLVYGSIFSSVIAFGNKTIMECQSGEPGERYCTLAAARIFTEMNGERIFPMHGIVIWSDKKQNVLLALCLAEKVKMWALMSTDKIVSDETKELIISQVEKMGFNKNKIQTILYDHCQVVHH